MLMRGMQVIMIIRKRQDDNYNNENNGYKDNCSGMMHNSAV